MDKEIVKKLIEETEADVKNTEEQIERSKIIERFQQRKAIKDPKGNDILGKIQQSIRGLELKKETSQEFIKFLKENE